MLKLFILLVLICATQVVHGTWWSSLAGVGYATLSSNDTDERTPPQRRGLTAPVSEPFCNHLEGLSIGQRRICDLFFDHMPAVGTGARVAIGECQWAFKSQRWNCSAPNAQPDVLGPVLQLGTREAAFTYAIVSAGVAHQVSRACKLGRMDTCGCSTAAAPAHVRVADYEWGGCGDNVDYGYTFAKNFVDVREKETQHEPTTAEYGQSLMNRWNNEAGRLLLKRHTRPRCKCHGLSGSCEMRTCWQELPKLRDVGTLLTNKYEQAVRVKVNTRGNLQQIAPLNAHRLTDVEDEENKAPTAERQVMSKLGKSSTSKRDERVRRRDDDWLANRGKRYNTDYQKPTKQQKTGGGKVGSAPATTKQVRKHDLIFIDDSPDYCRPDSLSGVAGTHGRECVVASRSMDSCDLLCCGRGYNTITEIKTEKCNCHFQWCCQVVCDNCTQILTTHICK